ncbi:rhamnan synthesis F family protein [Hydrogenophaga sp.]|uniref:rhamnan synthesis F family protein n=1 Tax=Hydrogenophaga sp. TaxID=1904254 RepID=UPI003D13FE43
MRRWLIKLRSYLVWQLGRMARAPAVLVNMLFGTLWYDVVVARGKRIFRGNAVDATRVVIYLIFPKDGLLASHLVALKHFLEDGYAPIVVSNVSLSLEDREELLQYTHHLIERPNYGYDFGGYRDGILFLRDRLPTLDRLALMNDSVWFPLAKMQDWLLAAEHLGPDAVGAVSNYFTDPEDERRSGDMSESWQYDTQYPRFHYCSFALSFGPAVLRDARFLRFWEGFRLSNNKVETIRRGEVGLGQWVVRSGHTHSCTLDLSHFDVDLDRLDDARLREVAENLLIPEDPSLRKEKALLLANTVGNSDQRRRLKSFILRATARTGPAYALLDFAMREKKHGFVKKSPLWLDEESAGITLKLLAEQGEHLFHEEALSLLKRRSLADATTAH